MQACSRCRAILACSMFGVFRDGFLHRVLNGSFYKSSNADFCFHSNLFAAALAIFVAFFIAQIVQINLTVAAHFIWRVISEHIERIFTGMETTAAQVCGWFLVGLADFVLKITAFQVFVEAFIHFHGWMPP